jgi:alpha-amylase/alpha-mannosidase (GH57 family)
MRFLIEPLWNAAQCRAMAEQLQGAGDAWRPGTDTAGWHVRRVKTNHQLDRQCPLHQALAAELQEQLRRHPLIQAAAFPRQIHSFLFSRSEFEEQVGIQEAMIKRLFGQTPKVFRNTELIYSNEIGGHVAWMGRHRAVICEGVDRLLGFRSPNYLYRVPAHGTPPGKKPITLMLKNYRLSDDIAFRFSDRNWKEWPLTAEKFARWVNQINGDGNVCNLFMDYETLGEHQWSETGIFEFLDALPGCI